MSANGNEGFDAIASPWLGGRLIEKARKEGKYPEDIVMECNETGAKIVREGTLIEQIEPRFEPYVEELPEEITVAYRRTLRHLLANSWFIGQSREQERAWEQVRAKEPNLFAEGATSGVLIPTASASNAFVGTPVGDPEQVRARKIQAIVEEFLSDHPGITFKTAYLSVQHENPKCFQRWRAWTSRKRTWPPKRKSKPRLKSCGSGCRTLTSRPPGISFNRESPELFDFELA